MFIPRRVLIVMFVISLIACLYNSVDADRDRNEDRDSLSTVLKRFSMSNKTDAVFQGKESFIIPLEILSAVIGRFLEILTWPIRVPYRLFSSLLASVGLLLLGCRIIPVTSCPSSVSEELIPEFMNSLREEMEFYADLVDGNSATQ